MVTVAGNLAFRTYLAPSLADLASMTRRQLALLLVLSGAGGLLGTRLAGRYVGRYGSLRALVAAGGHFCAGMAAFCVLWMARPVPLGRDIRATLTDSANFRMYEDILYLFISCGMLSLDSERKAGRPPRRTPQGSESGP
ncbi:MULTISPECIES: hypothetical protein [unclassified Streptomyces]|uniref:hypothetical protein n=1 Tax=unclassified Streptomyces TaxID=2593676 RepID=UPI003423F59D